MDAMEIVLATRNKGKAREIGEALENAGVKILSLDDFPEVAMPPEEASTFGGNALAKALHVCASTGLPALADDSGLEVDSLGGRPGVYSARYAGENATDGENCGKLLSELGGMPMDKRHARFRCVIAYAEPGAPGLLFEGALEGAISFEPKGGNGFGYDPVFIVQERGKTLAELSSAEKNAISHRGRAVERFKAWFRKNKAH